MPDIPATMTAIEISEPGGPEVRLTNNAQEDLMGSINDLGQVAWWRFFKRGCVNDASDIFFFDGQAVQRITDNEWANQDASLNNLGDIAWDETRIASGIRRDAP